MRLPFLRLHVGIRDLPAIAVSPTWWIASQRYQHVLDTKGAAAKANRITLHNLRYFRYAVGFLIFVGIADEALPSERFNSEVQWSVLLGLYLWAVPWSRCVEIFLAFYKDALDQFGSAKRTSGLTPQKRIKMAFRSYG